MIQIETKSRLTEYVSRQLAFHERWRNVTMAGHVGISVLVISFSTGATLISALNGDSVSAMLAGIATILVGLDKTLHLPEKWRLHVGIATALENILIGLEAGVLDSPAAIEQIKIASERYADGLPVGSSPD